MKPTPAHRKLMVFVLLALALLGGLIRQLSDDGSTAHDVGTLMLVLWLPIVGNIIAHLINKRRLRRQAQRVFAPDQPFTMHLRVRLLPGAATLPASGMRHLALVVGQEGFSARTRQPLLAWPADADLIDLELLKPALALPRLQAGTPFRVLFAGADVGAGCVV